LAARLDEYDTICFDVFDTLLLRACGEPVEVFERVGESLSEQKEDWPYSPVAYKTLRTEAEQRARARKPHGVDCTFDEILDEFPFSAEFVALARRSEIECEKQALYLNENVFSLMRECFKRGKTIVLVSDMYHGKRQILDFLEFTGMDTAWISDCFVSSEHACAKADGALFRRMLEAFPSQDPGRVLHVGDNEKADVEGARKAGMQTLHYSVVPREFGCFYDFEKFAYGVRLGEMASLRKLAAATRPQTADDEEVFFFAFGAEVIGPVYALFAEWVVRYAAGRGIKRILPFMREGELLSAVIARAARGSDIVCLPLFVSRQPAFIAGIFADNYDRRISQTLLRGGRRLKAVFEELGLDVSKSDFAEVAEHTLETLKANGTIAELESYLSKAETKNVVIEHSKEQRRLLLRYLREMTDDRRALTVDIGTKGSTERYLRDIGKAEKDMPALSHALMMGSRASNADNILDGIDIAAWLGIAGENDNVIGKLMYRIQVIETFVNATCGSVLRYEERNGAVRPVSEKETVSERQKRLIGWCQDGVLAFQEHWLSLSARKSGLCEELLSRKADFLNVMLRFVETPTRREAEMFGSLRYFDGFNAERPAALAGSAPKPGLRDAEIENFMADALRNGVCWPQAAVASAYPEYFDQLFLHRLAGDSPFAAMLAVLEEVRAKGYRTGVIFGASELGRKFLTLAGMLGVRLACFVDSDKRLHGTKAAGLTVRPLDEAPENAEYFVIASYIYAKEMRTVLENKYANADGKPVIFDFGFQAREQGIV
jgi:FMN phosphatase YigB (HAD superfamily)